MLKNTLYTKHVFYIIGKQIIININWNLRTLQELYASWSAINKYDIFTEASEKYRNSYKNAHL